MYPDRVNADGLAKGRPSGWHTRLPEGAFAPSGSWRALLDARLSGWFPVLLM